MFRKLFSIFKESSNSFEGQEEGEQVILILRRYPLWTGVGIAIIGASILVPLAAGGYFMSYLVARGLATLFWFGIALWALIEWLCIFYILTMYTLDIWIVTDRRIVDGTQQGLFNRTISELHLSRVQDISVHISGPIQSLFNFGSLMIQTAGAEEHFKFHDIPHPEAVKDAIVHAANAHNAGPKL